MKSDRAYEGAKKCYLRALKLDKDNLQVLRDLTVLQMQLRDFEGCRDSRYKILIFRPGHKASWVGYAVVHHLLGNYDIALNVLKEFKKNQTAIPPYDYENSELVLYQILLLMEDNKFDAALAHLKEHSNEVVDLISLLEYKAKLLAKLGFIEDAKSCIWELIDRNAENRAYLDMLYEIHGALPSSTSPESTEIRINVCQQMMQKYPRSRLPKRTILDFFEGNDFLRHLDAYMRPAIRKGVFPLFMQLQGLYINSKKVADIERLCKMYAENLCKYGTLGPISEDEPGIEAEIEPPTTYIWLNYFLAQHYKHCRRYTEALELVDEQLSITPTLVDFYVLKADIYHAAGDLITASRWMEEAQSLDTADRYINAICTKYMVQALRLDDSLTMTSKFTRGNSTAAEYLSEMQCMWFLTENARALKSMGRYGEALKICHEAERHYANILDDQLDFHSYCLRKMTLRAYVDALRMKDSLREHLFYSEIAQIAVEIYLNLHYNPTQNDGEETEGNQTGLSSAESKKLRNKQRKVARRAEAEAARTRVEQERREQAARSRQLGNEEADSDRSKVKLTEFDPSKLAKPDKPLDKAAEFVQPLLELSPCRIESYCLAYEVYERKNKLLLMLSVIARGSQISIDHPWFHECRVRFLVQLQRWNVGPHSSETEMIYKVLSSEVPRILEGWPDSASASPKSVNDSFMERNKSSYPHIFRGIFLRVLIDPDSRDEHLRLLPSPEDGLQGCTWEECATALDLLKNAEISPLGRISQSVIAQYRSVCAKCFPLANAFLTTSERAQLHKKVIAEAKNTLVSGAFSGNMCVECSEVTHSDAVDALAEKVADVSFGPADHVLVNGTVAADGETVTNTSEQLTSGRKGKKNRHNVHLSNKQQVTA